MRPNGQNPHSFSDRWARAHYWGRKWSSQVGYMIVICADSKNSALKTLNNSRFYSKQTRKKIDAMSTMKFNSQNSFWELEDAVKAFVVLSKPIRKNVFERLDVGIQNVLLEILGTLNPKLCTALVVKQKKEMENEYVKEKSL